MLSGVHCGRVEETGKCAQANGGEVKIIPGGEFIRIHLSPIIATEGAMVSGVMNRRTRPKIPDGDGDGDDGDDVTHQTDMKD